MRVPFFDHVYVVKVVLLELKHLGLGSQLEPPSLPHQNYSSNNTGQKEQANHCSSSNSPDFHGLIRRCLPCTISKNTGDAVP
jgi:hypothetical protein